MAMLRRAIWMTASSRIGAFGMFANSFQHLGPPGLYTLAVLVLDESQGLVTQREFGLVLADRRQAKLEMGNGGVAHEERAGDLQERRPLDDLDVAPEVALVVAEVAVPAPTGPELERHLHPVAGIEVGA